MKEKREPAKINLYWCYDQTFEYEYNGAYVFASTSNKARRLYTKVFFYQPYSDFYPDIRAICYEKDVGGEPEVCERNCERLKRLGYHYKLGHGFPDQRCETAGLDADGMCRGLASIANYDEPWEMCKNCEYYGGESDDVWAEKPRNHSKEKQT